MSNRTRTSLFLLSALTAALITSVALARTAASEPCSAPNVMPASVCDMDAFYSTDGVPNVPDVGEVPVGWTPFVQSGNPAYSEHFDTYWGAPSLMIRIFDEGFVAGIYTQVDVQPGAGYRASASWGAPNEPDFFGRQLGLDPTGGTDPYGPTVIRGPMHWGEGRILNYPPPDVNIDVRARAISDKMTLFFYVDHTENPGDNLIFIDAVGLYPDETAPPISTPTATPETTPEPTQETTPEPTAEATPETTPSETPVVQMDSASYLPRVASGDATPQPSIAPTSTPTTTTWSEPQRVAGNLDEGLGAHFGSQPAAIDADGSLLVTYSLDHGDDGLSGEDEAYVRQNIASSGWQPPEPISEVASAESAGPPSLLLDSAMSGHLLWSVRTQGQEELGFEYAGRDRGASWSSPRSVPALADYRTVDNSGTHHLVEVENDVLGVVWLGQTDSLNEVHGATRDATGWTAAATISPQTDVFGAFFPGVVRTSDSAVHVMWYEFAGDTRYALRDAPTGTWTEPMTATQQSLLYYMMEPGDNGDVHLLGQNEFRLDYAYKNKDADWETAFTTPESVAGETIEPYYGVASLAVDGAGNPHVAWTTGAELRYAYRDPAFGWSAPATLFDRSGASVAYLHLIADAAGDLHLLWNENGEIWYSTTSSAFR